MKCQRLENGIIFGIGLHVQDGWGGERRRDGRVYGLGECDNSIERTKSPPFDRQKRCDWDKENK